MDFGGAGRIKAVGFAINDKGYIGTGQTATNFFKDFWEYDPCDLWIRKADFGGTARTGAVGFSIGDKGYIGTGDDGIGTYEKDFWEYDPTTDSWTRKADFPGAGRRFAFAFSLGNKGYIGTGESNSGLLTNFWAYDPTTDTWAQISSLPAAGRKYAGGFTLNGKAYVGCGTPGPMRDFWEYDPASDTWTRKTDYPGVGPEATTSFTLGNYGYMGLGDDFVNFGKDMWQYNASTDTWLRMVDFGGTSREVSVGFSLCGKGYFGTGGQGVSLLFRDFWEFTPPDYTGSVCFTEPVAGFNSSDTSTCNNTCGNFIDASLNNPMAWQWSFPGATPSSSVLQNPGNICYSAAGNYVVSLIVSKGNCADTLAKSIAIIDSCACSLSIAITSSVTPANLQTGAVKVIVSNGVPPYQYSLDNIHFQSNNIFTSLPLGTYHLYVVDNNNCEGQYTFEVEQASRCCGQ